MRKGYLFSFFLLFISFSFGQTPEVIETNVPNWVVLHKPELNAPVPKEASGFYFLLVDNQDNILTDEYYRRRTYSILNTEGLGEMADFSVDFDAEFNHLKLHFINIIRNGEVIKKLNLDQLRLFQPESNADKKIYDKNYRALLYLNDIRVNDIIDFAYTIEGSNPIYTGNYTNNFYLEHTIPAHQLSFIVNVPKDENLYVKTHNGAMQPNLIKSDLSKSYVWQKKNPTVIQYEENTPVWYEVEEFVEVSQYKNWEQVNKQFNEHYQLSTRERNKLKRNFLNLTHFKTSDSLFYEKIIQYVQDDIRYLGLEDGLNSHLPSSPLNVLKRKYGDCKDKSFLLSELLKAFGLEANPMLVHNTYGNNIQRSLPSPDLFNHCVVQFRNEEGKEFFIDPTLNNQGGNLENIYFPDYGFGLILDGSSTALIKLPKPKPDEVEFTETFNVNNVGKDGNAYLEVISEYKGSLADYKRQEFETNTLLNIQKSYTDFYRYLYKEITPEVTLKYSDNRSDNIFTTTEFYKIDSLWNQNEGSTQLYAEFYPLVLKSYTSNSTLSTRKMPYALFDKTNIKYHQIINTPQPWSIKNSSFEVQDNSFSYNSNVSYSNSTVKIDHEYQIFKPYVYAEDFSSFLNKQEKVLNNLSFSLTYDTAFAPSENTSKSDISIWAILLTFLTIIGATIGCIKIYKNFDLPSTVDEKWHRPIGGWLTLLLIGLFITPLRLLYETAFNNSFYRPETWNFLFNNETGNFYGGLLIIFELVFNWGIFIYSILLIILFLQKRTILPRLIIILYATNFLVQVTDIFLSMKIFDQEYNNYEMQQFYVRLTVNFISIAIWIPYFLFSERVKDTFTKTRKPMIKPSAEEEQDAQTKTISIH